MTISRRYGTIADLPGALAVFPLRGCILLPRAVLPLQVFEPRYLAMMADTMAGTRLIGVVQPAPEAGTAESPLGSSVALRQVGCAGRITSYQELDDGRIVIALTGVCRFRIVAEKTEGTAYRRFEVDYESFSTDLTPSTDRSIDTAALFAALADYFAAHKLEADWQAIRSAVPEVLVNALAIMSPFGSEEKQALLESPDVKARAEALAALARMELAAGALASPARLQ